jgi:hypothetical protein
MARGFVGWAVGAGLLLAAVIGAAQEPPAARKDAPDKATADENLKAAERAVEGIEVEVYDAAKDAWAKVRRIEKPLLRYGDSTRENDRGSVWGWGDRGRPVALAEVFQNVNDRARWVFALCNSSGGRVRATRNGAPWWRDNDSVSELKDIPGAPAVATDAAGRPRQVKQLGQKFTGHEFWDPNNTRYDLRRLDRPLHTYKDEAAGLLEGGLFTLANGTNPEIVVFVEARVRDGKPTWQFTIGRLSHSELHVEYDGKEVFNSPRGDKLAGWDKAYGLTTVQARPGAGPKK